MPDGKHINCLLINVFFKLFPELIKSNKVYVIPQPLFGTYIQKQFVPIYTDEEHEKYESMKCKIQRYKGLGGYRYFA